MRFRRHQSESDPNEDPRDALRRAKELEAARHTRKVRRSHSFPYKISIPLATVVLGVAAYNLNHSLESREEKGKEAAAEQNSDSANRATLRISAAILDIVQENGQSCPPLTATEQRTIKAFVEREEKDPELTMKQPLSEAESDIRYSIFNHHLEKFLNDYKQDGIIEVCGPLKNLDSDKAREYAQYNGLVRSFLTPGFSDGYEKPDAPDIVPGLDAESAWQTLIPIGLAVYGTAMGMNAVRQLRRDK